MLSFGTKFKHAQASIGNASHLEQTKFGPKILVNYPVEMPVVLDQSSNKLKTYSNFQWKCLLIQTKFKHAQNMLKWLVEMPVVLDQSSNKLKTCSNFQWKCLLIQTKFKQAQNMLKRLVEMPVYLDQSSNSSNFQWKCPFIGTKFKHVQSCKPKL